MPTIFPNLDELLEEGGACAALSGQSTLRHFSVIRQGLSITVRLLLISREISTCTASSSSAGIECELSTVQAYQRDFTPYSSLLHGRSRVERSLTCSPDNPSVRSKYSRGNFSLIVEAYSSILGPTGWGRDFKDLEQGTANEDSLLGESSQ